MVTAYIPAAEDTNGFTSGYSLNIPKYDATEQPEGATTGEVAIIHLYIGDTELAITSPTDGLIPGGVGADGSQIRIDLVAYSPKELTIQEPDNGSITASPSSADNTYAYGTEVTLTAEPDIYYVFDSWTGDVTSASATTTIIMDDDKTVTASFSQCFYTLTMAVNDEQMGDITLPATGIGDSEKACGSDVTITASPKEGYSFTGWTGDVENSSAATTTVTMDGDKTVTANFTATTYTLTVEGPSNGTIALNPTSTGNVYGEDAVVTVTASPDPHYLFSGWTGDLTGAVSPTTITMDEDKIIGATFVECTKTLTMAISPSNSGSTDPAAGKSVQSCDSDVTITATPEDGYYFVGWTGDAVTDSTSATTTVTMDEDKSVTANFTAITYTLDVQSPSNGTISLNPTSAGNVYGENAVVTVTASPDPYYLFLEWTGDLTGSVSPTTITMDADKTIGATFFECRTTLTMAVNDSLMGSTTPSGETDRTCDEIVPINATPEEGYYFVNWTGSEGIEDPDAQSTTVTMDENKSVTANFVEISYTLTMGTSGNGTTTPVAGDHEYGEGAVVSITANPGSGYVFSSWTGDVANSSSRSTTITMDEDKTVTPNFTAAPDDSDDDDSDGGGGGGGGGIFGEISIRDVLGYHYDGNRSDGTGVYMPVTNAYKALKGAQTHVEGFAPNIASFIRRGFEFFEQKAESNKDGILYRVGTYSFPVLGKIAEYYLDIVGAEKLKTDAYADTTISIEEFKALEQQGKAVAPHRVNFEDEPGEESVQE